MQLHIGYVLMAASLALSACGSDSGSKSGAAAPQRDFAGFAKASGDTRDCEDLSGVYRNMGKPLGIRQSGCTELELMTDQSPDKNPKIEIGGDWKPRTYAPNWVERSEWKGKTLVLSARLSDESAASSAPAAESDGALQVTQFSRGVDGALHIEHRRYDAQGTELSLKQPGSVDLPRIN